MVFRRQPPGESIQIGLLDLQPAGVVIGQAGLAFDQMQGGAALGPGFGQGQAAAGEIEGGEGLFAGQLGTRRPPMQAPGDHQVQDEPELALQADGNAFAPGGVGPSPACPRPP